LPNQNPEQLARDEIDKQLLTCGWIVQNKNEINLGCRCWQRLSAKNEVA
jgi:hypothetical protein